MMLKSSLVMLWLLFFVSDAIGQLQARYSSYHYLRFKSISYGLFVPEMLDKDKTYPLVVYLHGSRDTVSRDMPWYQPAFQKKYPCFVLTPKCTNPDQGWGNTWTNAHTKEAEQALALVDSLVNTYNIDGRRLYLYGISMGGFGVFSILAKEQGKFAAGFAICGGSAVNAADKLVNTPLWIFHGEADDVVPVRLSRDVYGEMVAKGGRLVRYTEYQGVKHDSWVNALKEETLSDWLFAQYLNASHVPAAPVTGFSANRIRDSIELVWQPPVVRRGASNNIWFYRLWKDGVVVAELSADTRSFTDAGATPPANYTLEVVNYFFDTSKVASVTLK